MIPVVHVAADLGQGGTERSIELLATAAEGPPGQRVIALDRDGPTGERLRAAGIPVEVRAGVVRNELGVLAGSAVTLDAAVRNAVALGVDPAAALTAAGETPRRLVEQEGGSLRPGARADLVILEDDLSVWDTWVAGRPAL